jgi:predicted nucleic acid-binding protein
VIIVIADSAPLRYLIEINSAEILPQLFGRVLVPAAVIQELQDARAPEFVQAWISAPPEWLEIRSARGVADDVLGHLGAGEREAILLAQEAGSDWLILDDHEARQEAARRHIPYLGRFAFWTKQPRAV